MKLLPQSLRGRLVATAALFIVLALVATGIAVRFALYRFVHGQIDQRLDGQLMTIEAALEAQPDGSVALTRNVDAPPFDNPRTGWFWLARAGTQTWHARGLQLAEIRLDLLRAEGSDRPRPLGGMGPGGRPVFMRARNLDVGGRDVLLIAGAPLEAQNGPLRDALFPLATALAVLGAGLILATFVQVRTGLSPLVELQGMLAEVRAGRLARLPVEQPAEVRPLVGEMNSLLDENAVNLERARRHVANLAHGLKTPLAALTIALTQAGRDPDRSLARLAVAMDRQIRHHLTRARTAALGSAARISLPLAPRIADHTAAFAKIYADKTIQCHMSIAPEINVACDPQDLDEMVGNLLDNAFKWADSAILLRAGVVDRGIELAVEDNGPGVPAERMPDVLRPGQRLDESVSGDGFGLAIVQELAELYGGGLTLAPSSLGGLGATLTLPSAMAGASRVGSQ